MNLNLLMTDILFIGSGLLVTIELTLGGIIIGILLGSMLAIGRYYSLTKLLVRCLISVIRGTPLLLQMSLFYFVLPQVTGIKFDLIVVGIISLGLNSSAYVAEILRSGIESLPKGQFEAAKTLHIPTWPMWRDLILPQVVRNVLPALLNELIALLKETAIVSALGSAVMDVMRKSQVIGATQSVYFGPLVIAGCYYYILILLIEFIGKKIEAKCSYVKSN